MSKSVDQQWKDAYREIMRARLYEPDTVEAVIRRLMPKLGPKGVASVMEMVEQEFLHNPGKTELDL